MKKKKDKRSNEYGNLRLPYNLHARLKLQAYSGGFPTMIKYVEYLINNDQQSTEVGSKIK